MTTEMLIPQQQTAEPQQAPVDFADEQDDGRRKKLLLGGVAAALVLGGGAYFLLGSGGEATEDFSVPVTPKPPAAAAPPAEEVAVVPQAMSEAVGRNPFKPRYVAPAAAPAAGTGTTPTTTTPTTTTPTTGTPVVVSPSMPTSGGSTGGTTAPPPPPPAPTTAAVTFQSVTNKDGQLVGAFTVDGVAQTVKVGQTFGNKGQVLLVALHEGPNPGEWTAVLRVGDASPFDVTTGETAHVTS